MSRLFPKIGLLIALTVPTAIHMTGPLRAQDEAKPKVAAKAEAKGRLPAFFSKLGIDDKQKEAIYKVQAEYAPQLEKLEAELKALKEKRDAEIRDQLTKDQQKQLEQLLAGAKAKAAESKDDAPKAKSKAKAAD